MISERQFHTGDTRFLRWAFPVAFAAAILALAALGPRVTEALNYQRAAIAHGEWYRLLTGNFVHLDFGHALLNCAGFFLLPLLAEEVPSVKQWIFRLTALSIGVGAGLYLFEPELEWYVGLSGVLHGLFVLTLGRTALRGDPVAGQVLLLLMGKVAWEHYHGPLKLMGDASVVVAAHSYGIIAALIYAPIAWLIGKGLTRISPVERKPREKD